MIVVKFAIGLAFGVAVGCLIAALTAPPRSADKGFLDGWRDLLDQAIAEAGRAREAKERELKALLKAAQQLGRVER